MSTIYMIIYPQRVHTHNMEVLSFMALEDVIMKVAAKGAVFARKRTSRYTCFSTRPAT